MRFTLIDRIDAHQPGKFLRGCKFLALGEEYLADHFPRVPVMPGVLMLDGAPVFVEAHYRDRPDREGAALARFLDGVDQAVQLAFGQQPRIRSFAVAQSALGAVR